MTEGGEDEPRKKCMNIEEGGERERERGGGGGGGGR